MTHLHFLVLLNEFLIFVAVAIWESVDLDLVVANLIENLCNELNNCNQLTTKVCYQIKFYFPNCVLQYKTV